MFLAPKQSETTALSPAAGLSGDCCEQGRAGSGPEQKVCLLPTHRPWLRAGWVPQGPGEDGNFYKRPRHHLLSQPRQRCQLHPYEDRPKLGVHLRGRGCFCQKQLPLLLSPQGLGAIVQAQVDGTECTWSMRAFVQIYTRTGAGRPILMRIPVPPPEKPCENLGLGLGEPGPALLELVST